MINIGDLPPPMINIGDLPPRRQKIFGQCTILRVKKNFPERYIAIMYESNPTAIIPPPGNPRAFDLRLPPYRRAFDGSLFRPVGHLTT